MSHVLRVGVADQIAYFRAYNTDGSANTSLTASTTGLTLSVFRVGLLPTSILTLSNKAADNTAHSDGAIRQVSGNLYTIDLPDAACSVQCPSICIRGSYTGGVIEGLEHPLVGYDPSAIAVGANTITPPTAGAIADSVLTESILDHRSVNNSLAKFIWQIRNANLTIDGAVTDAITPTTLTFSSNVVAVTSAYAHSVVLFISGPLAGENSPIISYNNTNGVFLLEEPLTAPPSDGDEFVVIAGSHVHAIVDIANMVRTQIEASAVLAKESTLSAVATNVTTLINRITSGVASMFGDLITMITGAGTSNAKWTLSALEFANGSNLTGNIERSVSDTNPISFSWPVTGVTITAEKSMNNGDYSAVEGTISFIRTESGRHYYAIAYDPDDRNTEESSIRYKLTDGTYTKYFNLRLVPPGVTPEQIEEQLADNFQEVIDAVSSPTNSEKVLVDENYGGANRLTYMLRGRPVSDATIEVYLYSDYRLGRFNDAYRLDRTRQRIDGTWEKAFYLDPDQYAIRFNKSGVAGPDDYLIIVSFEESEIRIQKI